ncbi:MAG: ATP-binding protein, partial [Gemmatimonadaceae bacterium]
MAGDALAVRLLAIFVEELDEQVVQMGNDLTALKRTPGDAERLRSIFRVMHTLKGASRAAGVPLIEQLCHVLEGGLAHAKERATPLSADQLTLLVESVDALAEARERLAAGLPLAGATLAALIQRARGGAVTGPPAAQVSSAVSPAVSPPPPSPPPPPPATDPSAPRDESMRISVSNVEAIASATGELAVLVSCLGEHADDVAIVRTRLREQLPRLTSEDARIVDSAFAALARRAGADARSLEAIHGRLDGAVRHVRQRPLRELTDVVERVARDVARELNKQVRVTTTGGAIEADRVVLEALREPLLHLVRNAVDHGLESAAGRRAAGKAEQGEISIEASLRGDRLRLLFGDDGAGIDADSIRRRSGVRQGIPIPADAEELLRIIFDDGFSTRESATTLSGRGVGLSIVRVAVERLGGTVDVTSTAGKGMTFVLDVPLSVATMRALLVRVGTVTIALPSAFVTRVQRVPASAIARVDGRDLLVTAGAPMPVLALASLLGPPYRASPWTEHVQVVILEV